SFSTLLRRRRRAIPGPWIAPRNASDGRSGAAIRIAPARVKDHCTVCTLAPPCRKSLTACARVGGSEARCAAVVAPGSPPPPREAPLSAPCALGPDTQRCRGGCSAG